MSFTGEIVNGALKPDGILASTNEMDEIPVGACVLNANGTLHSYNRLAAIAWGRSPQSGDGDRYCGSYRLYYPDGEALPHDSVPQVAVLKGGASVRNIDLVVQRPDGSRLLIKSNVFPIKNKNDETIGAIHFFRHNPNQVVPGLTPRTEAHIQVAAEYPGYMSLIHAYPETAKPMDELADLLLNRETSTFTKADREVVASFVSYLNECLFCSELHSASAEYRWQKSGVAKEVWKNMNRAKISDRLRALLLIATKVQKSGMSVSKFDVKTAIDLGATERDVHDAVLIAAAFCMYNRYVDGLGTITAPAGDQKYQEMAQSISAKGYLNEL